MYYTLIPTQPHPGNNLHLKLTRPYRGENNITYTIPFTNEQILHPTNDQFTAITNFYLTIHDIDEATSGILTNNLTDFIHSAILLLGAETTQQIEVFLEIEDNNPNAATRLDVEVVIGELENTQLQVTEEEDGAVTSGKYLDLCLNMLVSNFIPPPSVTDEKKEEVHLRVHESLHKISYLIPLAPSKLAPILAQRMPKIHIKDSFIVTLTYVDNLLKLENSPLGKVVGSMIFMVVMERLRDLDLEIGSDDILQDDSNRGMFDMELEYAVESTMNEGDEFQLGALYQYTSHGNVVSDLLDKLMVRSFKHLKFCQNSGRLDEVFEILFESFENYILNTCKTKFSQFLMFYACSLDPENCGVKFASKLLEIYLSSNTTRLNRMSAVSYLASYLSRGKFLPPSFVASMLKRLVDECAEYCRTCNDGMKPKAHQVFYSGCQAILYVLCFRMRSILDIPRFQSLLTPLESILCHKLNPLMVCLPSVVSEFLKQAKTGGLFVVSEAFNFDDLQESELSRAFGGFERLDPCLLKKSSSLISPHFNLWSEVKTTYYDDDEVIVNEDAETETAETEEDCDDVDDVEHDKEEMYITPKYSFMRETERLLKMPSRIRPSTSPPESFLI